MKHQRHLLTAILESCVFYTTAFLQTRKALHVCNQGVSSASHEPPIYHDPAVGRKACTNHVVGPRKRNRNRNNSGEQ
jgi:hypothetical protein